MSSATTVVIADGYAAGRAAIRRLLERDGFVVAGEAANADEAVEQVATARPDVCVIDVVLPGDGVDAIRRIAAGSPETALVVLTDSTSRDHLVDAVRAGASGYLPRDMDPGRLPHAIRGVLDGEVAIPRRLVAQLLGEFRLQGSRQEVVGRLGSATLTRREWEVTELLLDGLSTAEIAARLFVAPVTVRRHLASVRRKLGAADRGEIVALLRDRS